MKYWELLLSKQRERGKDGLTLPFLIGSQNYLINRLKDQNIEDLIYDIVSSQKFEICIRFCMGTQTFIFEIRKPKNVVYYPKNKNVEQSNLSVAICHELDFGDNIITVIDFLKTNFQDTIDSKLYSAIPNTYERTVNWDAFSKDDLSFIENSFKFL